jgi:hypothetical protein
MLGLGLGINRDTILKTWLEKLNVVSAFLDTAETKYAKSRNLWIQIIRDSDSATLDVGYDSTSRANALTWSAGTSSYKCKRYNQISGKADITISSSSDQELIITGGVWVNNTAKYCLFEPSKSVLSVMDIPLSVNGRMKNMSMAAYIIQKDDKIAITGYTSDYVFPIKCSAGLMDFGWTNLSNRYWYLAGGSSSTNARPGATLGAGVSYSFGTNMQDNNIILNCYNTGVRYIGNLKDLPKLTYSLILDDLNNIIGDIVDIPKVTLNLSGWHMYNITGDFSNVPATSYSTQLPYNNISGIYRASSTAIYIIINGTQMTSNDTDQTLIYLAANTTVVSGGTLYVRNNRTSASDAAVASLAGKFTITYV